MKYSFFIILASLCAATTAQAILFSEFNPDYAQAIQLEAGDTVDEFLIPRNDYFGGIDFWVSNNGTAVTAVFSLNDFSGTTIESRAVSIPALADSDTGTRYHIDLATQIATPAATTYKITLRPNGYLRVYAADAVPLLTHNATVPATSTNGIAAINNELQLISLTHALYEDQESTPPRIRSHEVQQPAPATAVIVFETNEPVDRRLTLSSTLAADWSGTYSFCETGINTCSISLSVVPGTTYTYTLNVRDAWGNLAETTGTFTAIGGDQSPTTTATPTTSTMPTASPSATPTATPPPDITGPTIINARVVSLTPHSATFAWTTNEAANSSVVVQLLPYFINAGANNDSTFELEHLVYVDGLTSDTPLRATITSYDGSGNSSKTTINFLTPVETPTPATTTPPSSSPTPVATPHVQGDGDTQTLLLPPSSDGSAASSFRVDIFDSSNRLIKTILVPAGQKEIALKELARSGNRIIVYEQTDGVFQKVAASSNPQKSAPRTPLILGTLLLLLGGAVYFLWQQRRRRMTTLHPDGSQ